MYKTIYVPVDNSDFSNQAVRLAIDLGKSFGSKMVGCHVYAAKMHDYRFKQMEYTLPAEYLEETELERQRKIHDSLITMGLKLISDSYLASMEQQCGAAGLEFEPRMTDGKHSTEIVKDLAAGGYDLVVLGVLGLGRVRDSQVGSVCERVVRHARQDVLVVKQLPNGDGAARDTILVGIDGSPQSFGALLTATDLAKRFGKKVEAIAVYDPYLHYTVFNGIVNVLSEKAAKVFRFEEQNQLHEEVIDTGLAQIYQSHLEVAAKMAVETGFEIQKTLLDGKAFQKVLNHARKIDPWLLVVGRTGIHGVKDETELGSNAENLFRSCPCDLLLTTRLEVPELDVKAEESIRWTAEAEERMTRVPPLVQGIARTAIYRLAIERGHSVITSSLLDEAMERYMPKGAKATTRLAESVVLEHAKDRAVSICKKCGVSAAEASPVACAVCGGDAFHVISPGMVEEIIESEGGAQAETTYDGRTLTWTREAKRALWTIQDGYQRRRTKARVEKAARLRRFEAVSLELARALIEEETGEPLVLPPRGAEAPPPPAETQDGKKLVARDEKRNPLFSALDWQPDAVMRILRVPAGFMRNRTQQRIEDLARERGADAIDLALVEEGIEQGRQLMEEMIQEYKANPQAARATTTRPEPPPSAAAPASDGLPLNEVGVMAVMEARRAGKA
ncbi:MAG: universal stress protein [Deltaproteobacteria bacterium]|nr:universal stress protein [Deltaproteobacteria bacterium]